MLGKQHHLRPTCVAFRPLFRGVFTWHFPNHILRNVDEWLCMHAKVTAGLVILFFTTVTVM